MTTINNLGFGALGDPSAGKNPEEENKFQKAFSSKTRFQLLQEI